MSSHPSTRAALVSFLALGLATSAAHGKIVINEIMYHPPDDRDELQWIELHNTGEQTVDLAGWALVQGVRFKFTNSLPLPPSGYVVVARDKGAFVTHYPENIPVAGEFKGKISHSGERIELADPSGMIVDAIEFADTPPWPTSPDGMSCSLERRIPTLPAVDAIHWAPSPLPPTLGAAGTPGRKNAAYTTNLPPLLRNLSYPATPELEPRAVTINAEISDSDGVDRVTLAFRTLPVLPTQSNPREPAPPSEETVLSMTRIAGDARTGTYSARIPSQPAGRIVRFRIEATDRTGSTGVLPHPHDAHPSWSFLSSTLTNTSAVPWVFMAQHGPKERPGQSLRNMNWNGRQSSRRPAQSAEPSRGDATFVYIPPGSLHPQVFDHIRITPRQAGWKVRLQRDQLLDGMSTVNVLFEYQPRFVLAEHLAFEAYRMAGLPTPLSGHWRAWSDGHAVGYHLYVEQPNSSFLRRVNRDPDGDLFKLIWYGGDVIGQHEKKNNPESGHAQLVETIEAIQPRSGASVWKTIEQRINVDEFASYYAVNMFIQNWDGFFNNYFLFRSPGADGKWEIIPWDEDKTWGDYDGASAQYDWYTMPLTYGMAGDRPKGGILARFFGQSGPHGGESWWREPGWFSGPLLANPEFRKRFKTRLRELLETRFTVESMEPIIARMESTLEPEVRFRAGPKDANAALERFRRHIGSFRRQVENRRKFLLQELDREG
ncbi:MAG: CotH kinase family protein [Limisphaerales bacterium]